VKFDRSLAFPGVSRDAVVSPSVIIPGISNDKH
jgi:hypothetical protein